MELFIILGVIALIAVLIIGIYNRLVALRQTTNQAWSDIEVDVVCHGMQRKLGWAYESSRDAFGIDCLSSTSAIRVF